MIKIDCLYSDSKSAAEFVSSCEERFDSSLRRIADDILSVSTSRFITLAGPSCSGKTTTASKLTAMLEEHARRARVISIDNFYYNKTEMEKKGITDFEGPDAINTELFSSVLEALSEGRTVKIPVFDFKTRTCTAMTEYIPSRDDIYIFEGIQAIYPEITSVLAPHGYKSIFISVDDSVNVMGTVFEGIDIRLMRRTVRDRYHRATEIGDTMKRWPLVVANENANIYPYTGAEDYRVNSVMPYEVFLMAGYYREIAHGYGDAGVQQLVNKLSCTDGSAIDISMVPDDSVFREFIA